MTFDNLNFIKIVTIGFLVLESTNVITFYFFPDSTKANGVGVFNAWAKSKQYPDLHNFIRYLVNWIAGTKLIFILLLIVILATANAHTVFLTGLAMAFSIASFFWRLFPLIRKMDAAGEIHPQNYSAVLGWMILAFVIIFLVASILSIA